MATSEVALTLGFLSPFPDEYGTLGDIPGLCLSYQCVLCGRRIPVG